MIIISHPLENPHSNLATVNLLVDRFKLQKRRWRGKAEDGTEFGFEMDIPLIDGAFFHQTTKHVYRIQQKTELVLEIDCSGDFNDALRMAWSIGNLHMPLQIHGQSIRVCDDPALRHLFSSLNVACQESIQVFQPIRVSANIGHHHHSHEHSDNPQHTHG